MKCYKKIPEDEKQEMLINEEEKLIYCMLNVNEIHIAKEKRASVMKIL